jgi:precorrin-6B methylase 2
LLALLAPKTGERILDVGCGTSQLTAEIARSGAEARGDRQLARDDHGGAQKFSEAAL